MKKYISLILLIIAIGCSKDAKNIIIKTDFNFDSVDIYFKIVDNLSSGKQLTDSIWNEFLKTEGNYYYIKENNISGGYTNKLRKVIEMVYQPNNSLQMDESNSDIFYQIRNMYKENDSIYREHLTWIKNNKSSIVDAMILRTKEFLPNNLLVKDSALKIYYHALDHDGSANKKGIFISIMAAYDNNSKRIGNYEAHEFHHTQKPNILDQVKIDNDDKGIIWAIDVALNEGLADMVDKDVMLSEKSDWWLKEMVNDFYLNKSKEVISELDKLILEEAKGNHHTEEKYSEIYLGTVGHVPGYLMADAIHKNGKLQDVIDHADNPFVFFIIYNEITFKNSNEYPVFSSESMNYIKYLKNKYTEPSNNKIE